MSESDRCEPAPSGPVRLRKGARLTAACSPAQWWEIATHAENIEITNIQFSNLNILWPYCAYIPEEDVINAATEEILEKSSGEYHQDCSSCTEFLLADFDKRQRMTGHATVYVTRDGEIVERDEADCQIDFDYSFDLAMYGEVGICFSSNLRRERIRERFDARPK